jgi:hypothetical protein
LKACFSLRVLEIAAGVALVLKPDDADHFLQMAGLKGRDDLEKGMSAEEFKQHL